MLNVLIKKTSPNAWTVCVQTSKYFKNSFIKSTIQRFQITSLIIEMKP